MIADRIRRIALITFVLLLGGCGNDTKEPTDSDLARRGLALVAVTQCFIDHHLVPEIELQGRSWMENGKIKADAGFTAWVSAHRDTEYHGKTLNTWENEATAVWPDWKCPL